MIKKQIKIKNAQDEFFEVPVELIVKKSTYCQGVIGCSFKIKNVKDHFGHISTSGDLTLIIASRKSKILKSYITNEIPYEKYQDLDKFSTHSLYVIDKMNLSGNYTSMTFRCTIKYDSKNRIDSAELQTVALDVYGTKPLVKPYQIATLQDLFQGRRSTHIYFSY